jgi:hypothetical protein
VAYINKLFAVGQASRRLFASACRFFIPIEEKARKRNASRLISGIISIYISGRKDIV